MKAKFKVTVTFSNKDAQIEKVVRGGFLTPWEAFLVSEDVALVSEILEIHISRDVAD